MMWQIKASQSHRIYECMIMWIVSDKENKCKSLLTSNQKENSNMWVTLIGEKIFPVLPQFRSIH